jgi:hypothetical protein
MNNGREDACGQEERGDRARRARAREKETKTERRDAKLEK